MDISKTAALVVGGASGLGEAVVRLLADAGSRVTIADLPASAGPKLAEEVGAYFTAADVVDEASVAAAVDAANSGHEPLRIVVNCAGIHETARLVDRNGSAHDLGTFERVVAVNLTGTFNVMRLAAKVMASNPPLEDGQQGVIVNTSSAAAYDGQAGQTAYAASKGAVLSMTLPAARDLGVLGIRVCAISPGLFETPMMGKTPGERGADLARDVVFPHRLGAPAEFAHLVRSIIENPYLNAEVIRLDGGFRLPLR